MERRRQPQEVGPEGQVREWKSASSQSNMAATEDFEPSDPTVLSQGPSDHELRS